LILIYNKLFLIIPTIAILSIVLTLVTFTIPTFAQSEGTNETMQNAGESANKTGESMQQNASGMGSKITEGAKNMAENIGEGLKDLTK
jgi:hypothetical protein